jgi:hypothetical protein
MRNLCSEALLSDVTLRQEMVMARGAKKTSTKKGGGAKAGGRSAGKQRGAAKKTAGQKRRTSGKQTTPFAGAEGMLAAFSTLATSAVGREIIADVLESAAAALRKARGNVQEGIESGVETATETAGAAVSVASEVASGTVGLAQTAAGVLAEVATDAARSMLVGPSDDEGGNGRRRGRSAKG